MKPTKSWAPLAATVLATALLLQPIYAEGKNIHRKFPTLLFQLALQHDLENLEGSN
ncbi:hypothetical protein WH47_00051 [Habropoda laboriosa]|uniref:Uncharacterized protein n=1 Tax=Habropoda laboriosa TaxID=597456 RepID=A0A0L7QJI6_9HYME|nr:hypothetical protein WH47_00051 [Habropoda laboriosa]